MSWQRWHLRVNASAAPGRALTCLNDALRAIGRWSENKEKPQHCTQAVQKKTIRHHHHRYNDRHYRFIYYSQCLEFIARYIIFIIINMKFVVYISQKDSEQ